MNGSPDGAARAQQRIDAAISLGAGREPRGRGATIRRGAAAAGVSERQQTLGVMGRPEVWGTRRCTRRARERRRTRPARGTPRPRERSRCGPSPGQVAPLDNGLARRRTREPQEPRDTAIAPALVVMMTMRTAGMMSRGAGAACRRDTTSTGPARGQAREERRREDDVAEKARLDDERTRQPHTDRFRYVHLQTRETLPAESRPCPPASCVSSPPSASRAACASA